MVCGSTGLAWSLVEKGMENKGEQRLAFGGTMIQALELLRLAKMYISGQLVKKSSL